MNLGTCVCVCVCVGVQSSLSRMSCSWDVNFQRCFCCMSGLPISKVKDTTATAEVYQSRGKIIHPYHSFSQINIDQPWFRKRSLNTNNTDHQTNQTKDSRKNHETMMKHHVDVALTFLKNQWSFWTPPRRRVCVKRTHRATAFLRRLLRFHHLLISPEDWHPLGMFSGDLLWSFWTSNM